MRLFLNDVKKRDSLKGVTQFRSNMELTLQREHSGLHKHRREDVKERKRTYLFYIKCQVFLTTFLE